jgi:hypothetical protein
MSLDWIVGVRPSRDPGEAEPTARPVRRVAPARNGGAGDGLRLRAALREAPLTFAPDAEVHQWVPIGPSVAVRGQAEVRPRISGRVRAFDVSTDGKRVYAGTAQGGLWYSSDSGEHWLPLDFYATTPKLDGELGEANALAVGSVAVKFGTATDGTQDIVFVGTGEQKPFKAGVSWLPVDLFGVGVRVATGPVPKVLAGGPTANPWTLEATNLASAAILRLALEEDRAGVVWAATSKGLFRRPQAGGQDWPQIDTGLDSTTITDVVVTRGQPGEPRRIYVASSEGALAWSVTGDSGTFQPIELPPFPPGKGDILRVVLAQGNTPGQAVVFALAGGPRLWRVRGDVATIVTGLPDDLFGEQAYYDMAIAVHPSLTDESKRDWIAVGGALTPDDPSLTTYNASLYAEHVGGDEARGLFFAGGVKPSGGGMPASFIGAGVHPDVHDLAWVPGPAGGPAQLWVACDGGVFRSTADGAPNSFVARNSGLGTFEAQYIAQHPASEAVLLVGTQDNGAIRPLGPETWIVASEGDGGGVAIDPLDPHRQIVQSEQTQWWASADGGLTFTAVTFPPGPPAESSPDVVDRFNRAAEQEKTAASSYSSASVSVDGTTTQLAVGTDRVWLTRDWGRKWVTLPSDRNPFDGSIPGGPDTELDRLDDEGMVFVVKWASATVLHVVTKDGIYVYSKSAGGWGRARRYNRPQVERDTKKGEVSHTPEGQIPAKMPVTDVASHDVARAGQGSLYASTSGVGGPHVYWYDGTGRWWPAGPFRDNDPDKPIDSPVHALVVDPAHREVVYAGSDIGVWKGVGTFPAPGEGDPSWTWTHYSNGLPEASCVDLAIHEDARLLRVALRGRGIWEVELDGGPQKPTAYMRAHAFDTRRRDVPAAGAPDPFGDPAAPTMLRLDASPDVRIVRAPGTAPPPPSKIPPAWDKYDVWLLQSAIIAGGGRLVPDGKLTMATTTAAGGPLPKTLAQWNSRLGGAVANKPPFDHTPPDAADLAANLLDEPDRRSGKTASCATGDGAVRIFAVVHGRDWRPLPPTGVAVFVLRTPFTSNADLTGVAKLPAGWANALKGDLTAATPGAWLANTGWAYLDTTTPFRRPARAVDAREAQVMTFDITLPAKWPDGGWLLLAVVHADTDQLTATETDVAALVRTDHHVAARSVRRFA